jgi:5-(carboxyamino)imidazole ribonucleotide mutase
MPNAPRPLVGIAMGSESDWDDFLEHASHTLNELQIPHEKRVLSAHRTPDALATYAKAARKRGIKVLIGGAGGAAHLPGMAKAQSDSVPTIGVPRDAGAVGSILDMPAGVPVATMAPGKAGAINAAILAAEMLAIADPNILRRVQALRKKMKRLVAKQDRRVSDA